MKYYNIRNSLGRFTRKVARRVDGKFANRIVAGRLYDFKGVTVRAMRKDTNSGARLVSFHKTLFGFVSDAELKKVDNRKVQNYLASAEK